MSRKTLQELFGVGGDAKVAIRETNPELPAEAYVPVIDGYFFRTGMLKRMLHALFSPSIQNVFLTGDTGTGKSSLVEQVCARLNVPVFSVACSAKLRFESLLGGFALESRNGATETVWRDGPVLMAARHGGVLLLDEVTRMERREQMALAKLLDSGTITVPATGEIVRAKKHFMFFGTGNSRGHGDSTSAYNGEVAGSSAFFDRFQIRMIVDWMPAEDELALIESKFPDLKGAVAKAMVDIANKVRKQFIGRGGSMRTVISTRGLLNWASLTCAYAKIGVANDSASAALEDAIINSSPDEEGRSIMEMWTAWQSGSSET